MSAAVESNSPTAHSSSDSPSHRGSPPLSNKVLTGEALHSALVAQLEWYFSRENLQRDAWLVSQLQGSGWVSVDVICSFRKVERLTTDRAAVVAAMKSCKSIMLDASQSAVRPSAKAERNTLILRDISSALPQEQVRTIFEAEGCPGTVSSLRSDVGDCWFVVFANEQQCTDTALWLIGRTFQGNEIHARVKSVAASNPSIIQATAMNMHANTGGSITTPLAAPQSLNQHNQTTLPNNHHAGAGVPQSNEFYYPPPQQPFMFAYPPQFYGQGNYPQQQQGGQQGYQPKNRDGNQRFNNQSPNQYGRPMNGAPRSNNPRNPRNNKKGGYNDEQKPRRASRSPEDGDVQPVPLDSMQFPSLAASLPDEPPAAAAAATPEREASPAPVVAVAAPVAAAATDASSPSAASPTSASGPKGWASIVNTTKPVPAPAAQSSSPTPKTTTQSNNQGKKTNTKSQREENVNNTNGAAPAKSAPVTKAASVTPAAAAPAVSAKNYAKMVGSMPAADAAKLAEQLKAARDAKEAQKRPVAANAAAAPSTEQVDAPAANAANEKRESERFQRWSEKRERQEKKALKVAPVNGAKNASPAPVAQAATPVAQPAAAVEAVPQAAAPVAAAAASSSAARPLSWAEMAAKKRAAQAATNAAASS